MANKIDINSIGEVKSPRKKHQDDEWGEVISTIVLSEEYSPDTLMGLDSFSHAEIVFYMDQVVPEKISTGARHPRNNPEHPKVGIFSQRGKNRPNQIGVSRAKIISLSGRELTVQGLDAIDGTPVLDIKPFFIEMNPREAVHSPEWVKDIMKNYY